jgi:hypothetical protein
MIPWLEMKLKGQTSRLCAESLGRTTTAVCGKVDDPSDFELKLEMEVGRLQTFLRSYRRSQRRGLTAVPDMVNLISIDDDSQEIHDSIQKPVPKISTTYAWDEIIARKREASK